MAAWIERRAALSPDSVALITAGERLSWRELAARVHATARALSRFGVTQGDVVATLLGNDARFVELVHALPLCGAVLLPLNERWTPGELAHPLRESGARWLVHGEEPLAERARSACRIVPEVHAVAAAPFGQAGPGERCGGSPRWCGIDPGETAAIVYTSGTKDRPKGVELTHANLLWSAVGSATHLGALGDDRWLACLPLSHVAGLSILMRAVLFGSGVVLHARFEPGEVWRSLMQEAVTLVSLVPTQLARLLDGPGPHAPPPWLRCVLLGGGPIPDRLLERAWRRSWPVAPTYGLTETASQVATLPLPEIGRHPGAKPLFTSEIAVVGPDGGPRPPGTPGEIEVRGPTVMTRYRGRPEATAAAFRDGWLRTGDVGCVDPEGFLHVLARRSDLIVTGGENVAPAEVEQVLLGHPGVQEAGVAPEPDPEFGQRVAAWVVLRPGAQASVEEIQGFCRLHLAGYKIPRIVRFVPALPRNTAGKLLRRHLPIQHKGA